MALEFNAETTLTGTKFTHGENASQRREGEGEWAKETSTAQEQRCQMRRKAAKVHGDLDDKEDAN